MKKLLLLAVLAVALFAGALVGESGAVAEPEEVLYPDIIAEASKVQTTTDCRVADYWGERMGKQIRFVYLSSRVNVVWGCKLACGSDLNCWNRGSIFIGWTTTAAGSYGIDLRGVRKAHALWTVDGYFANEEMWYDVGNEAVHPALLSANTEVMIFGRQCYDANEDDSVSGLDFFEVMSYLGTQKGDWLFCRECDFNDDDAVSGLDFFAVIGQFGLDCWHPYSP